MTTYLTDQIAYEMANEELIVQGEITAVEADDRNETWEQHEWTVRWKQFPRRAVTAFVRLQSATLIMRAYEYVASFTVTEKTLDKLTKDPFKSAKRKVERYTDDNDTNDTTARRMVVGKKMFHTCLWASAVSFLSDYTVQQCILVFGHVLYYRSRREARHRLRRREQQQEGGDSGENTSTSSSPGDDMEAGGIGLSLALKSSSLMTSRATSWVVSSAAGAIGSAIYPGWGTLFGTQVGDGLVGALLDD